MHVFIGLEQVFIINLSDFYDFSQFFRVYFEKINFQVNFFAEMAQNGSHHAFSRKSVMACT